jgi:hypothetical protein
MSLEKVQLLMRAADRVRMVAEEVAKECGFPERIIAIMGVGAQTGADWVMTLANKTNTRNPGVVNFLCDQMPEPPETRQAHRQTGEVVAKREKRPKVGTGKYVRA